ncbi:MAG: biotin/lipoyl-binding protein [Clostridia bacterium]|nr:biotin/lipoyl-binding protein [Clostridia bacterium]
MKKNKRKWIYIALAVVILAAAAVGGVYYASQNREPVYVFSFQEGIVGMTDYYDYTGESSGMVTTDRVQNVFLTQTQTVKEILVSEGQEVKKGDVLFTYDTTLSDIQLMQKDIAVQQAKLDLETAQKELRVINSYVPIRYYEVIPPEPTEPPEPIADLSTFDLTDKTFLPYSGSGSTSLTPKYCWLKSDATVDETMMQALFEGVSENVLFVLFQHTAEDKADGEILSEYGIKLMRFVIELEDGTTEEEYRFAFFEKVVPEEPPVDPGVEWNSGYTAAEIAQMRTEKQAQIKDLEFKIKMEEAEYNIMQKEADSGELLAEFDGTVMGLTDPEFCDEGMPLMKVTDGGGFYIEGSVSELQLDTLQLGQTVDIMSWDTGMSYEGTVTEVGQFPMENNEYYYGGSQNVSYYPYTVFVDGSAELQDGFYVSMTLRGSEGQGSLYIDNAFLRTEGAKSYVYVRGADGNLEKRNVQVGGSLWGSYTQIRSGLTGEDWLAFPYGKDVRAGAPTQEGTWEDLYN